MFFVRANLLLQLERIGFFVVDPDTKPDLLVLNRVVTLRESTGKASAPPGRSRKEEQASKGNVCAACVKSS